MYSVRFFMENLVILTLVLSFVNSCLLHGEEIFACNLKVFAITLKICPSHQKRRFLIVVRIGSEYI